MSRRTFGQTWWGRAWVEALEGRARLDPNRLPRGRTYARQGRTETISLQPGRIVATVQGRRPKPYRVEIRVRELTSTEWDRVLTVIASRAAHAAALLDGELDPGIDADAREAGIELLPDTGEIQPRCSCPDWADPCKHAAAVCYLAATELDIDPYLLLQLRGRTKEQVQAGIRAARGAAKSAGAGGEREGANTADGESSAPESTIRATDVFARQANVSPDSWPESTTPPAAPSDPAPWPTDPPAGSGLDAAQLRQLAGDAAARAWAVLAEDAPSMLGLRETHDLARRAAAVLGSAQFEELADRAGMKARALARLAIAWREAGPGGVDVAEGPSWRPSPEPLIGARQALAEAGVALTAVRIEANRVTVGDQVQLRFGMDRRWYRLEKNAGAWELAGPAADDPGDLL